MVVEFVESMGSRLSAKLSIVKLEKKEREKDWQWQSGTALNANKAVFGSFTTYKFFLGAAILTNYIVGIGFTTKKYGQKSN